jgi:hypothetical protein
MKSMPWQALAAGFFKEKAPIVKDWHRNHCVWLFGTAEQATLRSTRCG